MTALTLAFDGTVATDGTMAGGRYDSLDSDHKVFSYQPKTVLTDVTHQLTVTAYDYARNSASEVILDLRVRGGDLQVIGPVLNYPNPFNPDIEPTTLSYILSKNADVIIYVFDIGGSIAWRSNYFAGQPGGRVGNNKVVWDGVSVLGQKAGNGIYHYRILAKEAGNEKIVGKGKITVFR